MATAEKTVIYSFLCDTTANADNVQVSKGTITVALPESSKAFKSVFLEVAYQDQITATGGTLANAHAQLQIDATAIATRNATATLANSGENLAGISGIFDFTTTFQSFYSGTSHSILVNTLHDISTGTTLTTTNICVLLYITYTYDDTSATLAQTAIIPINSLLSGASTLAAASGSGSRIGSLSIPQLTGTGGLLDGMASVTIDDWFVVMEGSNGSSATTTYVVNFAVDDAAAAFTTAAITAALNASQWNRIVWKNTSPPASNAAHQLNVWAGIITRFQSCSFKLYVTYRWTQAGSTRFLNSVVYPMHLPQNMATGNALEKGTAGTIEFHIPEPGTLELVQSGIQIHASSNAQMNVSVAVGQQGIPTMEQYTCGGGTIECGQHTFTHRIDPNSPRKAAFVPKKGRQLLEVNLNIQNNLGTVNGALLYLNYRSDISSLGIGAHSASRHYAIHANGPGTGVVDGMSGSMFWDTSNPTNAAVINDRGSRFKFWEPSRWFLSGLAILGRCWQVAAVGANNAQAAIVLQSKLITGGNAPYRVGSFQLGLKVFMWDGEAGYLDLIWDAGRICQQTANDVYQWNQYDFYGANQYDDPTVRKWDPFESTNGPGYACQLTQLGTNSLTKGVTAIITTHSIYNADTIAVTGYSGDGSGIEVNIWRTDKVEIVRRVYTVAGGTASFDNLWPGVKLFAEVVQGSTAGRSVNRTL